MDEEQQEAELLDFEEKTTTEIAKAFDLQLSVAETLNKASKTIAALLHTFAVRALKPMIYLVVAVIISQGLQWFSLIQRDDKVDQIKSSVETLEDSVAAMQTAANDAKLASNNAQASSIEAKTASEAAKRSLDEALAQSQRGGVSPEIIDALKKINDLYETCAIKKEC